MTPRASVVITLFNEEKNIDRLLSNLNRQTSQDFDIVFVDDGSKDSTLEKIHSTSIKPPLTVYARHHTGLRPARAFGVSQARGDIVITVDADEEFGPDLVQNLVRHFDDPTVGAVGGFIEPTGKEWFHKAVGEIALWSFLLRKTKPDYTFVFGGCAAYRCSAITKIGGLPQGELGEDVEASWMLQEHGWKVILDENIRVQHIEHTQFRDFFVKTMQGALRLPKTYVKYQSKKPHLFGFVLSYLLPHRAQTKTLATLYSYLLILILGIYWVIQAFGNRL